jgi:hypothetical protein
MNIQPYKAPIIQPEQIKNSNILVSNRLLELKPVNKEKHLDVDSLYTESIIQEKIKIQFNAERKFV